MRRMLSAITFIVAMGLSTAGASAVPPAGPGGWDDVGGGLNDRVQALNTDMSGQMIVGGRFYDAGGVEQADKIALWNGSTWSALGSNGMGAGFFPEDASEIRAIEYDPVNNKLYVGGTFTNVNGDPANDYFMVWDGATWSPACGGAFTGNVWALHILGSNLYVGGDFQDLNAVTTADRVVSCPLAGGGPNALVDDALDVGAGSVLALASDSNGDLYVGGQFINHDQQAAADYIVKFDPDVPVAGAWSPAGFGTGGPPTPAIDSVNVDALAAQGLNVFVGTDDEDIGGEFGSDHIARYDGTGLWSRVGINPGIFPAMSAIYALLPVGNDLYATGAFNDADGDPLADGVLKYNQSTHVWSTLGNGGPSFPNQGPLGANGAGDGAALATFQGNLIVGGAFVDASGDAGADRIAAFPLPTTVPPQVLPPPTQSTSAALTAVAPKKCKRGFKLKKGKCRKKKRKK